MPSPFPIPPSARCTAHPGDFPSRKKGDVLTVEFTVMGIPCLGLNGGPAVQHNWAFSFQVATADQAETDRYWNAIIDNGGQASACGWCTDKWGLSWQITPVALTEAITSPDPAAAQRLRSDDGDGQDRHRSHRSSRPRLSAPDTNRRSPALPGRCRPGPSRMTSMRRFKVPRTTMKPARGIQTGQIAG